MVQQHGYTVQGNKMNRICNEFLGVVNIRFFSQSKKGTKEKLEHLIQGGRAEGCVKDKKNLSSRNGKSFL